MRAQGNQEPPTSKAGEDEPETLPRGRDTPLIGGMHRGPTDRLRKAGEEAVRPGVVERQQPNPRGPGGAAGDMREGATEPAVAVVDDDERLQAGVQADRLPNRGVTSASMAAR